MECPRTWSPPLGAWSPARVAVGDRLLEHRLDEGRPVEWIAIYLHQQTGLNEAREAS